MIKPIIGQPASPALRGKTSTGKRGAGQERSLARPPKAADENIIPTPESLSTRIKHALASLKEGVVWDRGSIINLNI